MSPWEQRKKKLELFSKNANKCKTPQHLKYLGTRIRMTEMIMQQRFHKRDYNALCGNAESVSKDSQSKSKSDSEGNDFHLSRNRCRPGTNNAR